MKCEVCLKLLEEYVDSELADHETEQVSAHLITCVGCANEFDGLTAEQEIYSRYDRALDISPSMWGAIAARTVPGSAAIESGSRFRLRDRIGGFFVAPSLRWSFAGALAVLLVAVMIGMAYLQMHRPTARPDQVVKAKVEPPQQPGQHSSLNAGQTNSDHITAPGSSHDKSKSVLKATPKPRLNVEVNPAAANQSDVLFPDAAYSSVEEQETQTHIEQAQNLLRSVRNIELSEDDTEIDVTYEKTLSRQLLNENVVLRRDAEMSGKFPVKTLLSSLEPFLLDIANLPDQASADDLREIKERVQKTEIVAALHSY